MNPDTKMESGEQRRHKGQGQRRIHNSWGIDLGKPGDQALGLGPSLAGRIHQIQDSGHGGGCKLTFCPDGQHAGQVDAAGEDPVPCRQIRRHRFAGDFGGVHRCGALHDDAVHGNPLTGVHPDQIAHLHILGVGLLQFSIPEDVGHIRPQIHQSSHALPGALHGDGLKQLTHLEEQHDRRRFHKFSQENGAAGSHSHQEILVKRLLCPDFLPGIGENLTAHHKPGRYQQRLADADGQPLAQQASNKQRTAQPDPPGHLFLLLIHLTMVQSFS